MPEVHVHKAHHSAGPSIWMLLREVSLISIGVFLGMVGEQWRETRAHHELAAASLRNFRAEIVANRTALADVRAYHEGLRPHLNAFLCALAID